MKTRTCLRCGGDHDVALIFCPQGGSPPPSVTSHKHEAVSNLRDLLGRAPAGIATLPAGSAMPVLHGPGDPILLPPERRRHHAAPRRAFWLSSTGLALTAAFLAVWIFVPQRGADTLRSLSSAIDGGFRGAAVTPPTVTSPSVTSAAATPLGASSPSASRSGTRQSAAASARSWISARSPAPARTSSADRLDYASAGSVAGQVPSIGTRRLDAPPAAEAALPALGSIPMGEVVNSIETKTAARLDSVTGTVSVDAPVFASEQPTTPVPDFKPPVLAPGSPMPAYPTRLESSGIEGRVLAEFVVGPQGQAEVHTFRELESDHPVFTEAVLEALPRMRFSPAVVAGRTVPQRLVMPFTFTRMK